MTDFEISEEEHIGGMTIYIKIFGRWMEASDFIEFMLRVRDSTPLEPYIPVKDSLDNVGETLKREGVVSRNSDGYWYEKDEEICDELRRRVFERLKEQLHQEL